MVAQSVETVQPFIDGRRQALKVVVPQQPAWLLGDMARLTQVIANLLHNAAKYSPEGTGIELRLLAGGGRRRALGARPRASASMPSCCRASSTSSSRASAASTAPRADWASA